MRPLAYGGPSCSTYSGAPARTSCSRWYKSIASHFCKRRGSFCGRLPFCGNGVLGRLTVAFRSSFASVLIITEIPFAWVQCAISELIAKRRDHTVTARHKKSRAGLRTQRRRIEHRRIVEGLGRSEAVRLSANSGPLPRLARWEPA